MRLVLALLLTLASGAGAQTATVPPVTAPYDKTIEVTPSQTWTDTGIELRSGDMLTFTAGPGASGESVCNPQGMMNLPDAGKLPLESALPGALLARLEKSATPIFVGANRQLKINETGHLYLGSNLGTKASCLGNYSVKIHVAPGADNTTASIQSKLTSAAQIWLSGQLGGKTGTSATTGGASQVPGSGSDASSGMPVSSGTTSAATPAVTLAVSRASLDSELEADLQSLPRRVNDEFKNPGDMVNFVLIGSEKQVQDALTAANWHVADTSTPGAIAKAILMATKKEDYLQMPMSQLYLFGRVQDFGYEMAEPYAMVASRHHFRIWKAPVAYKGQPVWAGAGTHDIGFEKDQRNGKVTHKIDPAIDGERDNIGQSLEQAGRVKVMHYFLPSDPIQESKNATGGGFHSDGRLLVIVLQQGD